MVGRDDKFVSSPVVFMKPLSQHSDRETVMILGEICNFAGSCNLSRKFSPGFHLPISVAYAFVEAIVVVSPISPPHREGPNSITFPRLPSEPCP